MGKQKHLSEEEKTIIGALILLQKPSVEIAAHIGRHKSTIGRYINGQTHQLPQRQSQPNQRITIRQTRQAINYALNQRKNAREISATLNGVVGTRRIQQILSSQPHIQFKKMKTSFWLTKNHKKQRLTWVNEKLTWPVDDWRFVIFSDEKKFNLQGPDGMCKYWHDLRREPKYFQKQTNTKSVMVYAAICFHGTLTLAFFEGNVDSHYYCQVLEDALLPDVREKFGDDWTLVHDNAPINTSHYTRNWMESNDIDLLDWPPHSPDLNIIENVFGEMVRRMYGDGKIYANLDALREGIEECWDALDHTYIKNLYSSIHRRLEKVKSMRGGPSGY